MLGSIPNLKFADQDLCDENKFPYLAGKKYPKKFIDPQTLFIRVEPKTWETLLDKLGILNLLQIPHFGRSAQINACINMVLSCVHGIYLCLDIVVFIDIELIVQITGLPTIVEDPSLLFIDNSNGKSLSRKMK
jgi:hypothetical protein